MKLLVWASVVAVVCGSSSFNPIALNYTAPNLGVVNGDPTGYTQWRGVLAFRSDAGLCTSVAISPSVLLSAAHCCREAPSAYTILGGADINAKSSTVEFATSVEKLAIAPFGDLCMVKLSAPLPEYVPFYDIEASGRIVRDESTTIVGYGFNTQGFPQGGLGIARMGDAKVELAYLDYIDIGLTNQASCNGDSGGPMFVMRDNKMVIAGVTSAGVPGCLANGPAIYSSVSHSTGRSWVVSMYAQLDPNKAALTPGSCSSCNPGDCAACPKAASAHLRGVVASE
jgi:hypothetical protein